MTDYLNFGFLPEEECYSGGHLVAEPLPDIRQRISSIMASGRVDGSWLHPPLCEKGGVMVPCKAYIVPETHCLRREEGGALPDEDLCDLVVTAIGFFKGLRLIPEGWNHFYRTPIHVGELVDFYFSDAQMGDAMSRVVDFWHANVESGVTNRMFGAIHWFLCSQSYEHDFELFSAQYTVLDTCWRIFSDMGQAGRGRVSHAERPVAMCEYFGIPVPAWAVKPGADSYLSNLRNGLLHEGCFAKAPIGFKFSVKYPDIDVELRDLNSRLLLALLGFKVPYVKTLVDHRGRFRLILT
jgi:hypothetical protein